MHWLACVATAKEVTWTYVTGQVQGVRVRLALGYYGRPQRLRWPGLHAASKVLGQC